MLKNMSDFHDAIDELLFEVVQRVQSAVFFSTRYKAIDMKKEELFLLTVSKNSELKKYLLKEFTKREKELARALINIKSWRALVEKM